MSTKNFKQAISLACSADTVYKAWMSSKEHGAMTDSVAKVINKVGGEFDIWEGDITGTTLALDPTKHTIQQSWRYNYSDWPEDKPSTLTIQVVPVTTGGCRLRLWHSGIPTKYAADIAKGWKDYYWAPMKLYFANKR
jgi:activator of HSP90 ATPase